MPYTEGADIGNAYRQSQMDEMLAFIEARRCESSKVRDTFFRPDYSSEAAYAASVNRYRSAFFDMLGWPLNDPTHMRGRLSPTAEVTYVGEDELGKIERVVIDAMFGLTLYGILFTPSGGGKRPAVISQHGGGGTPELCSGFYVENSANYWNMTLRARQEGYIVFAPQLHLWSEEYGPQNMRAQLDVRLKQLGGSITSVEIFKLMRAIDWLSAREDVDNKRIGMLGLSYGGFYTLFAAAADTRIRAAVSSCFFNDRYKYDWPDWTWFNSGNRFLDPEVCALVCPRALYVEVGKKDALFDVALAEEPARRAKSFFDRAGASGKFEYVEHDGEHEFNTGPAPYDFLKKHLDA